jgi:hypothetical protein
MKKHMWAKAALLLVTVSTLSGCIWVPGDEGGHGDRGREGEHHEEHHEGHHEDEGGRR